MGRTPDWLPVVELVRKAFVSYVSGHADGIGPLAGKEARICAYRVSSDLGRALLDIVLKGLFDRFPKLMIVSAESDVGWAGNLIERADFWYRRNQRILEEQHGTSILHTPSHYFRNNIRVTFMRDLTGVLARDVIGLETMMWGNDFPHHVSTWPDSQKVLDEHFANTPPEVRNRITRDNVRELYHF